MKHSKALAAVAALFLLVMILDSKVAIAGAAQGVQLCVATVIPSLFPFFIVSILLTGALSGRHFQFLGIVGKKLGLPQGGQGLLLIGFLGGYPIGAQSVAQACRTGNLSKQDGERMLAFCSNAGPAFLFGIGSSLFPQMWMCWLLWGIHIISSLAVGLLTARINPGTSMPASTKSISLTEAMHRAVNAMAMVCGWIVMFRTIIAFCEHWFFWLLPSNCQLLLTGLLEMTNGCCSLKDISSVGLRMQYFSVFLGFGGLCVLLQTKAVLSGSNLTGSYYFPGKMAQSAFSYLLCILAQPLLPQQMRTYPAPYLPLLAAGLCLGYGIYQIKIKKCSSISALVGV